MFDNLRLKNRILLGYVAPTILWVISAGSVYTNAETVRDKSSMLAVSRGILERYQDMALNIQVMQRSVRGYLLDRSGVSLNSYQESKQKVQTLSAALSELVKDPQQQAKLPRILAVVSQLDAMNREFIALVDRGQVQQAIEAWKLKDGREYDEEITSLLKNFEAREKEIVLQREEEKNAALNALVSVVVAATALSVLLAIAIGLWVASGIAERMSRSASAVATASREIAVTMEEQERNASHQAASVNQTTTSLDELGASSQQVAQQAESAARGACQALSLTGGGTKAVDRTLEGMATLREKVDAIAQQAQRLSERTSQISSIASLVSDLANQTHMLALNAAIEAVRAGEGGKGFGVVASEIRKLADQSKKSAEKINALVADINTALAATVIATDEGSKTVEQGMGIARETADAFAGVADAINQVVLNNQQISLSIKQQAAAIQQVADAMNAINTAARETATGITQVKIGTQQLNEAADALKAAV
ncbi:methyl-accepting chemotaxis protein [Kamptonema formosum]|uniref:methyl-accepting chemotaxis protein n=1 Tax=Kamptonema formosum TaxID=331992 RepID=UPI000346E295|nr:methyl-accepting chemotaxis protein [Oscillatoria sp. PCC 10802]